MKPKVQRRNGRWSDRSATVELVSPYTDKPAAPREPRSADPGTGQRPYEASYDISLGYGHDRSIVLP